MKYVWRIFIVMLAFYIFSEYLVRGVQAVWEEIVRNLACERAMNPFANPLAVVQDALAKFE